MAFIQSLLLVQSEKGQSKLLGEVTDFFFSILHYVLYKNIERHEEAGTTEEGTGNGIKRYNKGKVQKTHAPTPTIILVMNQMNYTKINNLTLEAFLAHTAVSLIVNFY